MYIVVTHPAKFSKSLIEAIVPLIEGAEIVVDSFAGEGGIHLIAEAANIPISVGVELEKEWSDKWSNTEKRFNIVGDSTRLATILKTYGIQTDLVVTSMVYGNRMSDHHEAKDDSKRNTYRHHLGRALSENNAGKMHFARNGDYENLHELVWIQVDKSLAPGGKVVLNSSDFLRTRNWGKKSVLKEYEELVEVKNKKALVRCRVTDWHKDFFENLGFETVNRIQVKTRRNRNGANGKVRVDFEDLTVLRKPV